MTDPVLRDLLLFGVFVAVVMVSLFAIAYALTELGKRVAESWFKWRS